MNREPTVLVVDDEEYVRESIEDLLEGEGWQVVSCAGAAAAERLLEELSVDIILTDLRMPERDGLSLLRQAKIQRVAIPVILLTGVGTITDAVEAMKLGAYDFVQKPVPPDRLVQLVRRALTHYQLQTEVENLRLQAGRWQQHELIGSSAAMTQLRALVEQIAPSDGSVLVTGESGTGKELVATLVHRLSDRQSRGLVRMSCAAIPDEQFEAELLGRRGAGEERVGAFLSAEGGTLVLDEIANLKPEFQLKLVGVLESGEYSILGESKKRVADFRLVATTNEDLLARVESGAFRKDLYYRLNHFPVHLPPLREHLEDIPEIAEYLLNQAKRRDLSPPKLTAEAVPVLQSYDWPGNVRELRNVLERAIIAATGEELDAALVRNLLEATIAASQARGEEALHLRTQLDQLEKELIERALHRTDGKKREAAQLLGIDPKNLGYYLKKHSIS